MRAGRVLAVVSACALGACTTAPIASNGAASGPETGASAALAAPAAPTVATRPDPGKWKIARRIDPLTGVPAATASIAYTRYDFVSARDIGTEVELMCFKSQPIVRIEFLTRLGSNRSAALTYRFDDRPGRQPKVRFLQNYRTIMVEDRAEVVRFVNELATSRRLYLHVTSVLRRGYVAARLDTRGAPAAIAAAYATCPIARETARRRSAANR